MKRAAIAAVALALTACGSDAFVGVDGGPDVRAEIKPDAADGDSDPPDGGSPDVSSDSSDSGDAATTADASDASDGGCSMVGGATACSGVMDSFCSALLNKCGGMTIMQCRAWWASNFPNDFDCTAMKFQKSVCIDVPNKCANVEIPSYFCGKLQNNTPSQLGGSCTSFFAEFP